MSRALRKLRGDFQVSDAPVLTHSESEEEVYGDAMKNNPFELGENEIDETVESLQAFMLHNQQMGAESVLQSSSPVAQKPLLYIDLRKLDSEAEMQKLLREKSSSLRIRKEKGDRRRVSRNQHHNHPKTVLVTAKPGWPFIRKSGVSMVLLSKEGNVSNFKYEHSKMYQEIQFAFLDAVESLNPDQIKLVGYPAPQLCLLAKLSQMMKDSCMGDTQQVCKLSRCLPVVGLQCLLQGRVIKLRRTTGAWLVFQAFISFLEATVPIIGSALGHSVRAKRGIDVGDGIGCLLLDSEVIKKKQANLLLSKRDLVAEHPYHLDALLQLSEMFHFAENYGTAVDLIERALFFCESAFHPLFRIASGTCRLSYRYPENRALFIALFKQSEYVAGRGCPRTGLEYAKILLSLDPDEDPLAVLLYIDTLAIQSKEFEYLLEMNGLWETSRNLSQLPNFAFSVPLAQYHLNRDEADTALQEAILRFPAFVSLLMDKCGIQSDRVTSQHPHFSQQHSDGLMKLIKLYVARSYKIWKLPEVLRWLEENMSVVIGRLKSLEIAGERDSGQNPFKF
ncbi:unnamed protein product [Darwinula stevensoni]|uniref:Transcription factor 25 n=1 Tax=Darwinula stevensoni TaxID=69355 RepID=A0A7R8X2I0_9CRUS|nr:unnamed protein product [Darwinula stevensoni]CAG0881240.1 unnamed protein product [Darwinula stevensoni]